MFQVKGAVPVLAIVRVRFTVVLGACVEDKLLGVTLILATVSVGRTTTGSMLAATGKLPPEVL